MVLFQYLDYLPPIPENLVSKILTGIRDMPTNSAPPLRSIVDNNSVFENISYKQYVADKEVTDWVRDNISSQYTRFGVQIQNPGQNNRRHAPHADSIDRTWVLNYVIQPGGPDVVNTWYHKNGVPVKRPGTEAYRPADITEFETLESVQFETGRWHLLTASILHGVENIISERISMTLGFELHPVTHKLLVKEYDNKGL